MSVSSDVRSAWETNVWSDASIVEPTINYQLPASGLIEADVDDLYYNGGINFFQSITRSVEQLGVTGQKYITVYVDVYYYRQIDVNVDSFNPVIDRLEDVRALVSANLGIDWKGVVEYYQLQSSAPAVVDVEFGSTRVWRGAEQYVAQRTDVF